jgi:hypothetical protein
MVVTTSFFNEPVRNVKTISGTSPSLVLINSEDGVDFPVSIWIAVSSKFHRLDLPFATAVFYDLLCRVDESQGLNGGSHADRLGVIIVQFLVDLECDVLTEFDKLESTEWYQNQTCHSRHTMFLELKGELLKTSPDINEETKWPIEINSEFL